MLGRAFPSARPWGLVPTREPAHGFCPHSGVAQPVPGRTSPARVDSGCGPGGLRAREAAAAPLPCPGHRFLLPSGVVRSLDPGSPTGSIRLANFTQNFPRPRPGRISLHKRNRSRLHPEPPNRARAPQASRTGLGPAGRRPSPDRPARAGRPPPHAKFHSRTRV